MSTILITGANRGLGLELVKQYAAEGWQVYACCRHPQTATELQALCSQQAIEIIELDVNDLASIQQLKSILQTTPIDILFNSAGVWGQPQQIFGQIDPISWSEVLHVNTIAPLLISQVLIDNVANSNLKIIANMSSFLGSIAENQDGEIYAYRSSKAALNAVTKSLAIDLKKLGITVVSLHPGWVQTDMGGENAPLTAVESIRGLKQVLATINLQDSGSFITYDGAHLPW
jgi:NAD(P)-dependent dehydrogenase (short-subunit alcohol dehydrogenase family)